MLLNVFRLLRRNLKDLPYRPKKENNKQKGATSRTHNQKMAHHLKGPVIPPKLENTDPKKKGPAARTSNQKRTLHKNKGPVTSPKMKKADPKKKGPAAILNTDDKSTSAQKGSITEVSFANIYSNQEVSTDRRETTSYDTQENKSLIKINVQGNSIPVIIDTASSISLWARQQLPKKCKLIPFQTHIKGIANELVELNYIAVIKYKVGNTTYYHYFRIIEQNDYNPLFGQDILRRLQSKIDRRTGFLFTRKQKDLKCQYQIAEGKMFHSQ